MKQLLSLFALSLSLLFVSAADRKSAGSVPPEFTQLYARWDEALVKSDLATLDKIYADEVVMVDGDGVLTPKAEFQRMIKTGEYKATDPVTSELSVQLYGKTAVVSCVWKATEIVKGETSSAHFRCTDTWIKKSGRWELVATQATSIKPQK
jgi:ketosteroid isomerase-like protein